ncbi:hypothetical protein DFH06DRAFT_934015, partial [Mycena polygramma]
HQPTEDCACDNCEEMRESYGCVDPHSCYSRARELLDELPFKWDPRRTQPEDYEVQEDNNADDDGWIVFDKSVTTSGPLANIFRIFTEGDVTNNVPD